MIRVFYTGLLFLSLRAAAQEGIQAETDNGKPYILHTITSGQTLSSLSRSYKVTIAEIASLNKINADKGLQKDQVLRIPLRPTNLSQTACASCVKVYHKVEPKEGLYRIGLNFGNIKAETLRQLNNLPGESVDIDQNLLVGYLPASANGVAKTIAIQQPTAAEPVKTVADLPKNKPASEQKPVTVQKPVTEQKPVETIVKKDPPPAETKPQPEVKPETKPQEIPKQTQTPVIVASASTTNNMGSGLFTGSYEGKMGMEKTGTAAVFKSISGWNDAKYYVLINNATPGTIVKITGTTTGKTVYAKVLDQLPQIKQNENVLIRISDAAASALGSNEESLNVTVNY